MLYGSNGHLLEPVIREHLREVLQAADVLVFTVYLQVRGGVCVCDSAIPLLAAVHVSSRPALPWCVVVYPSKLFWCDRLSVRCCGAASASV